MSEALQPCDPCAVGLELRCTELRPKHPRFIPQPNTLAAQVRADDGIVRRPARQ